MDSGSGLPVVDAGGSGNAITLSTNGCTLKDFVAMNSSTGQSGIRVTSSSNTISGNTAKGNTYGILLGSSSGNTIFGNIVTGNIDYGIYLYLSSGNTISGNIVTGNTNYGIYLTTSSNGNTINSNTATGNRFGVYLSSSSNNIMSGNTATSNSNFGIYLGSSNGNNILGNTATGNTNSGIYLSSSTSNTISGNNATLNSNYGIELASNSNGNTINGNTVTGNINYGISLNSCSNNTISGNTATGNRQGIVPAFSSSNIISGNIANSNTNYGIHLIFSNGNTISSNTATGNGEGIRLSSSSSNNISGNTANSNINLGIILNSASSNTISGNTATGNTYGILLSSSSSNAISGNTATGNNQRGIYLISSSNGNNISGNTVTGNVHGIYLSSSSSNIIYLNTLDSGFSNGANNWNSTTQITYGNATTYVGNNWSNYAGFDCDGNGIGDTPYPVAGGLDIDYHPIGGILSSPGLEAEKIADISEAEVGDWINYTVHVNNIGNVNLTGVRAEDNLTGAVWNVGTLLPGQNYTNTTSYQVSVSDLPGPLANELWANGTDPCSGEVNDSAIETVNITGQKLLCISGYKHDGCTGLPLSGWRIEVNNSTQEWNATTDGNGFWRVCNLENDTYTIREVPQSGWAQTYPDGSHTETLAGVNITNINFTNQKIYCISGYKKDNCTGAPIPGWNITLQNATGTTSQLTGPDGKYEFCNLKPGDYTITEEARSGYTAVNVVANPVTLNCSNITNQNFTNQKLLCINGTKIDGRTGLPLAGWTINLQNASNVSDPPVIATNTTDSSGNYSFCGLESGDYIVCEVLQAGWKSVTDECIYVELECEDEVVNFENIPKLCINGSKTSNCTGEGLANWTIELRDQAGDLIDSKKTDASGDYSFCNLEAGNYTVCELLQEGWKNVTPSCIPVTLDTDSSEDIDFANDPSVCINGTKINDCTDEGIPGWKITLYDAVGKNLGTATTDANGKYSFCNLTPGIYYVCEEERAGWKAVRDEHGSIEVFGSSDAISEAICPWCDDNCICVRVDCEGAEVDFRNIQETLCINGTNINNCTDAGLVGWSIYLYDATGKNIATTQTDSLGRYSFCNLAPGQYRVCEEIRDGWVPVTYINHSGASCLPEDCTCDVCNNCIPVILDCESSEDNDFENIPPLSIKGKVIDDCTGLGLKGWTVKLSGSGIATPISTTTKADGSYEFKSSASLKLTAGTLYSVCEVVKDGYTPVTYHANNTSRSASPEYCIPVFLDCGETEVEDFENIPPLLISGHEFNHCTGEGLDGWTVHLKDGAGNILETTTTDDAGYYQFSGRQPGWYTVCEDSIPVGWTSFRDDPNSPAMALPGTSAAPEDCERPKCIVVRLDYCEDATDTDFENIPTFCIKGAIYNNSTAVVGFPIKIENSDGTQILSVPTDAYGEYSFCGLKAGTYTVCVNKPGWTADEPCVVVYLDCMDEEHDFDVYMGRNPMIPGITQPAITTLDSSRGAIDPGAISVEPSTPTEPDIGGDEKAGRQPATPEIA